MHEVLRGAGFDATLQPIGDARYNAVGRLQGQGSGKSLMFNGHLDTSFGPEQAHRGIGYQCKGTLVDDEWIYGMGSFNMKSALATYVVAVEAIRAAGIRLGGDVVIAGVAGEIEKAPVNDHEGPQYQGYGVGTKFAITHGAIADYCILGEPTNMMLIPRHCGSTWVKITVPGHLIHTAWSDVERNAINRARKVLDAIHDWIPGYCRAQQPRRFPAAGERFGHRRRLDLARRAHAGQLRASTWTCAHCRMRCPLPPTTKCAQLIAALVQQNPAARGNARSKFS